MPKYVDIQSFFKKCKHINQITLATAAGMSESKMSHFANGRRKPSEQDVIDLNNALDRLEQGIASQLYQVRVL